MEDFNAKAGKDNIGYEGIMGSNELGTWMIMKKKCETSV